MTTLGRLLAGEVPPREAFWNWLLARGLVLNLGCTLGALVLVATAGDAAWPLWLAAALHLAAVPLNAICVLGIWRATARHPLAATQAAFLRAASVIVFIVYLVL
ncbi:MAG: hypothetical protein R3D98_06365 [Candidatus Krumholzibacteriia bacterium]